ncbi:MAG: bifunctional phosphopantothenoylcysteine decarboxylase/phosphopantothenate--cysteine ligase CoaBC, partial [Mesobacillus sp.]|uniref:bifunctional phosphopantothenoylcysteine decarboxylase/phosphopantothenate--cysteine ligase CoaBC n=1 Tax=Mesobacillus sp. TaxID=2675271 RepID=UPI003C3EB4D0
NVHMYNHPAVRKNMETLRSFGCDFIEPAEGYLACGYTGKGRLEEPEKIVDLAVKFFNRETAELAGKTVLITAGPTREKIDPVRFLTNHSTGKMGYAIASEAKKMGARVVLISGPVHLEAPKGVELVSVESAEEMYLAAMDHFEHADVIIGTAAVADYRPKYVYEEKMKKKEGEEFLELERTKDILFELGKRKTTQLIIGFAAETTNVEEHAKGKLVKKNADMIVANDVKQAGAGFGTDTNIVTIYNKNGTNVKLPLMAKTEVARNLLLEVIQLISKEERL